MINNYFDGPSERLIARQRQEKVREKTELQYFRNNSMPEPPIRNMTLYKSKLADRFN